MKKTLMKLLACASLSILVIACMGGCGSSQTESSSAPSESASTQTEETNALADTSWTADIGEEYGAAVQGDEDETLTTLTLYFSPEGYATNVVGDVSFDYALNDDGTVDVSNLNLGDTAISSDVFELTYEDGALTLHTRINGGNATLTFTQNDTGDSSDSEASNPLADTAWTADVGEEYGAAVQGDEEEALTTLSLYFSADGYASNVVGDISFDYSLNDDGTVEVSNLNLGDTAISSDVFELTYEDGALTLHTRINGGNATLTFEQDN